MQGLQMPFSLYVAFGRSCDTEPELHGVHLQLWTFMGLWGSWTTLNIELEPLMESGGFISNFLTFINWEVPEQHSASNLNLPWNREGYIQLWTSMELSGSWATYDIDLEPPMESGGSCSTLNLCGVERFRNDIWHQTCSSHGNGRFISNFEPSWSQEIPDEHLFLRGIKKFLTAICSFMGSRGSWPNWNLHGIVRFLTNIEPSWNREVPFNIWAFMGSKGSYPSLNLHGTERFLTNFEPSLKRDVRNP